MKNPLWIFTGTLSALFVLVFIFLLLSRPSAPRRTSLRAQGVSSLPLKDVSKVNVAQIYENDLFNTFVRPEPANPVEQKTIELPQPPAPQVPATIPPSRPQFFAPLDITLKGVIYAYEDKDNRVIIADNKSKNETIYKIGDHIEDADIIYIGKNKVVFLRTNGQQETIFITAEAAQNDPLFSQNTSWTKVVRKIDDAQFVIDPKEFINRIPTPAQIIDMLDLTTAFDRGKSVGLRVGKMDQRSIGPSLGLQFDDIIISINGIATTSTKERVEIYQALKNSQDGSVITIDIMRNNKIQQLTYKVQRIAEELAPAPPYGTYTPTVIEAVKQEKVSEAPVSKERAQTMSSRSIPSQGVKLAKRQDKQAMHQGGRNALLQRMPA